MGASTSHSPMGLHGLLQGELYFFCIFLIQVTILDLPQGWRWEEARSMQKVAGSWLWLRCGREEGFVITHTVQPLSQWTRPNTPRILLMMTARCKKMGCMICLIMLTSHAWLVVHLLLIPVQKMYGPRDRIIQFRTCAADKWKAKHESHCTSHTRPPIAIVSDKNKTVEYVKHGDVLAQTLHRDCFVGEGNVSVESNSLKRACPAFSYFFSCFVKSCFLTLYNCF
jgi:hypothetical protein